MTDIFTKLDEFEAQFCLCGAGTSRCQPGTWEFCAIHSRVAELRGTVVRETNENLAGMRAAYEKALWDVRREIPTSEPTFSACLKAIRQLPNEQADAGVQAIELRKEIALARHIKGGALDGCMCDPCVAVRSLLPQIKETHLETAKQFLRDRPRVVLENPEAAEMQPYVTKESLAELLRAIEERLSAKHKVEIASLLGRLHTIGMAGEFGKDNSEVVTRLRELEDTNYAARQYIQNAKQREARIAELENEQGAIERRVLEKADAAVDAIPNINLHAKGEAKKAILALKGTATQPSDSSAQTPATPA